MSSWIAARNADLSGRWLVTAAIVGPGRPPVKEASPDFIPAAVAAGRGTGRGTIHAMSGLQAAKRNPGAIQDRHAIVDNFGTRCG